MSRPASPPAAGGGSSSPILSSAMEFPELNGSVRFKRGRFSSDLDKRSQFLNSSVKIGDPSSDANMEVRAQFSLSPMPKNLSSGETSKSIVQSSAIGKSGTDSKLVTEDHESNKPLSEPTQSLENQNQFLNSQEQKAKISYSAMIDHSSRLPSFSIDSNKLADGSIFEIPSEVEKDDKPLWTELIVGSFPDKAPHPGVIHVIIKQIWKFGFKDASFEVYTINKRMVRIRINIQQIRDKVLNRGMWTIADLPMVVSNWSPIIEEVQPVITHMPVWVIIKDIPHNLFTRNGISYLASAAGTPKRLHQETILCTKFDEAKVQVEVDLNVVLPKEMLVRHSLTGLVHSIKYAYPWLPPKCSSCSKWGHLKENCLRKLIETGDSSAGLAEQNQGKVDIEEGEILSSQKVNSEQKGIETSPCKTGVASNSHSAVGSIKDTSTTMKLTDTGDSGQGSSPHSHVNLSGFEQRVRRSLSPKSDREAKARLTSSPLQKERIVTQILQRNSQQKSKEEEGWMSPSKSVKSSIVPNVEKISIEAGFDALKDMGFPDGELGILDSDVEDQVENDGSNGNLKTVRNLRTQLGRATKKTKDKSNQKEKSNQKGKGRKAKKGRKGFF